MKKFLVFLLSIALASILCAAPTITSFTPSTGPVGTLVTITGSSLSSPSAFTIGGVKAIAISNNGTTLVGLVMPGATTGKVVVTIAVGAATGAGTFTVTATPSPVTTKTDPKCLLENTGEWSKHFIQTAETAYLTVHFQGSVDFYYSNRRWKLIGNYNQDNIKYTRPYIGNYRTISGLKIIYTNLLNKFIINWIGTIAINV